MLTISWQLKLTSYRCLYVTSRCRSQAPRGQISAVQCALPVKNDTVLTIIQVCTKHDASCARRSSGPRSMVRYLPSLQYGFDQGMFVCVSRASSSISSQPVALWIPWLRKNIACFCRCEGMWPKFYKRQGSRIIKQVYRC